MSGLISNKLNDLQKLETLKEDLENVTIDNISIELPKKSNKNSVSAASTPTSTPITASSSGVTKGLGIQLPRRPSDSMFNKNLLRTNGSKVSISERPVSNDSIFTSSSNSEFSEEINSRNSSLTSGSIDSPIIKNNFSTLSVNETTLPSLNAIDKSHRLRASASTSRLSTPTTSTSSVLTNSNTSTLSLQTIKLTPSQRYRLRRQSNTNTPTNKKKTPKTEREHFYDQFNSDDELEDDLIWNVPFTKGTATVFSPVSGKPPSFIKSVIDQSPVNLPMSPLPGSVSAPSSPLILSKPPQGGQSNSYFYNHPDEAQSITRFYEASSENYANSELYKRTINSQTNLPSMIKEASNLGMEDLKLISKEKSDSLTSTRPIWLPPKDSKESKKHERDIAEMFEKAAKLDKKKQEQLTILKESQEKNKSRWKEFSSVHNGHYKNSQLIEMKRLSFKSSIPDHLRFEIWSTLLNQQLNRLNHHSNQLILEKFDELDTKLNKIPELPNDQISKIEELATNQIHFKNNSEKLIHLLKLQLISSNDESHNKYNNPIMLSILLEKFNKVDSFNLNTLIKNLVLTDINMVKFENNLNKNTIMKKQLTSIQEFNKDFKSLNDFEIIFQILTHFENLDLIYQILDIWIIQGVYNLQNGYSNYKIHYALILTILKNYHFGFKDLNDLINNDTLMINVDDGYKFMETFYHYFKKF